MVTVTGAAGHIGNTLIRQLIAKGEKVRAFCQPMEDINSLKGLNVEIVYGDVRDTNSLITAFKGSDQIYHLAGIISIGNARKKLVEDVNVRGTENVIAACFETGIKRLVYVSSIHAFTEPPHGTEIIETKKFNPLKVMGLYARTKATATNLVLEAIGQGLDAVIVHPTGVIGPYEFKASNMGQLFIDYMNGKLLAYINGTYDFVDVRDVAAGIILACEKGVKGENYILSGEQITVNEIMDLLHAETGLKRPTVLIPIWFALATAPLSSLYYRLHKRQPLYSYYSIKTLSSNSMTSHRKASEALGYSARPIRESIIDTVKWHKTHKKNIKKTAYVSAAII